MTERTRKKRISFYATEKENEIIQKKMELSNAKSMQAYLIHMAMKGYLIEVDFSQLDSLATELSRIGNNLNQLTKRANETHSIYGNDVKAIREDVSEIKIALLDFFTGLEEVVDGE